MKKVTIPKIQEHKNINFHISDLFVAETRQQWSKQLLESPMIFLDVDPHNGSMEIDFYRFLYENHYQGLLICDDIWYFKEMRDNFWFQIPAQYKCDVTRYGHWSGTGLIHFGGQEVLSKYLAGIRSVASVGDVGAISPLIPPTVASPVSVEETSSETQSWTLVTAYFDLTQLSDNNPHVRPSSFYLNQAHFVMSYPANLVVYCDAKSLDQLKSMRPIFLAPQTQYNVIEFDQLKLEGHEDYEKTVFGDVMFVNYYRYIPNGFRLTKIPVGI